MDYFIKREELSSLDKIARSSFMISNVYKKLYELEVNGLINSDIYKINLENLKLAIELENKKYEDKEIDLYKTQAFMKWYDKSRQREKTL